MAAPAPDYLVVGAGASGMAFVDTLLLHSKSPVSVTLLDVRAAPGGHWNDAYGFVTLHQPARNYGVESTKLEERAKGPELRATRDEVLAYYAEVLEGWRAQGHAVEFVGRATYDFGAAAYTAADGARTRLSARKVVDCRFTENDLPCNTPPKFGVAESLDLIAPNELSSRTGAAAKRYVVLGAGKTGQDAVLYLRDVLEVPASRIAWVMPTAPWITARDPPAPLKQHTCMEFLGATLDAHAAAGAPASAPTTPDFLTRGFEAEEAEGRVYRIDPAVRPSKFMDATLNAREVGVLRGCAASIVHGRGRVASIGADGALAFADGSSYALPWAAEPDAAKQTTFVHCTAGAFNFGRSAAEPRRPVFGPAGLITVQEVFQFPGFCFNGALIAWLEAQPGLDDAAKNARCEQPPAGAPAGAPPPLGQVTGDVGPVDAGHPLLVAHRNLRRWYATPGMGEWLHGLRLFSLAMNGYTRAEGEALAEKNHAALIAAGLLSAASGEAP